MKRAKKPKRLPVVLSEKEVASVINQLDGVNKLVLSLIYGSGLRISEALRLRVLYIDFDYKQIAVRNGKGLRDRITMLPESIIPEFNNHIKKVFLLHKLDLKKGLGRTILPKALAKKYPGASQNPKWQYLFPSKIRRTDPRSGVRHRYHISPRSIRSAVKNAVKKNKIQKRVTPHTFRHSFATHPVKS